MKLLSLETYEKEISIHNAWGNGNCYDDEWHCKCFNKGSSLKYDKWKHVSNIHYRHAELIMTWFFFKISFHTEALFLTSLTDEPNEGTWFWESTDTMLYPGYSNWCSKQPDDTGAFGGEDCMVINYGANGCWNDCDCDKDVSDAICQALP
jgi:hypothetical protein